MSHLSALDGQLNELLASTGVVLFYLLIWALVFAGTAVFLGVFIPFITGDSLLFGSGLVAASTPSLSIAVLAVGTGIAAFLGDQVGFLLGRHYGRSYLDRHGGRRTRTAITKTEAFYRKYGWWSVVVARFMPWGRVFVPVVAGVGRMNYYKFLTSNLVGALAWGVGLTLTGYYAAAIPGVKNAAYVIAGVFITASIIFGVRTLLADRAQNRLDARSALIDDPSTS
ncbi:DedA family protein [Cryobacterium sinapicolor]|uniref:DedA family protein n=1 Tax=Cryobacterium sinapicolor TaxID=1259236 RepID=A0ABY2ITM9_9MICO|nr:MULTISPECIES: DedA family protein [Cryobacterium]TFC83545.1 DedA family protein [Cryobacterium sp. TMT3-29-2]TFC94581.1 DedA family protein [Cryobacterium sinapicolor]